MKTVTRVLVWRLAPLFTRRPARDGGGHNDRGRDGERTKQPRSRSVGMVIGLFVIMLALGGAACASGIPQKDYDAVKQQLGKQEQEASQARQQLSAREQESLSLRQQVSAKEEEIKGVQQELKVVRDKSSILTSEIGFLAYWHNVPGDPERRASPARVVAELERRTGLPGYVASHMPIDTWTDGISYLEARGVKYFLVVYMDDQPTYGSTLPDVLQWMLDLPGGRGVDPSKTKNGWGVEKPHPSNPQKYGNIADYMGNQHIKIKTYSNSVFVMTAAPTDPGPYPIDALERQIRAVMKDPANTSAMLVDHGAAIDEVNNRWLAYRQTQADALKARLGLKRAGAFAIREDWKDLWPASVANMVATANDWARDSTVIHVPIREKGIAGGGSRTQVEAEYKKAQWTLAPAMMEVEANREALVDWAADTLGRAAAWIRTTKPTANTFFDRTERGVEGGIMLEPTPVSGLNAAPALAHSHG